MKSMKKNILAVLCTSFVASLAFSVGAVNVPAANAETETYTVETVQMREGASVRVGEEGEHADKKGIRFSLLVSQEYYATFENPVVGVYVVPASYVENATEMQSETSVPEEALHFYTANVEALGGDIAETANDTYSFNAVIYGIPADEFGTDLIANGYIVEGEGEKEFASNPQTRSIAQVASLALATGDTRDGLTGYVDGVVTEENFKLKDVRMDASQATTPSVVETLPKNLTAIWTSSNEEVVTVNANGELTFTGVAGEATITAKLGTKEATATATYVVEEEPEDTEMPVVLKASEEAVGSVIAIKNGTTHTFEYAPAGSFEFAGEYAGDAMKLAYVSSTDYRIANPYTVEELEAFKEEYTGVTLYFAFDDDAFTAGGQFFFYANNANGKTFIALANGGVFEISANVNALKTWYKFTVSIDDYIKTLSEDGSYFRFAEVGRAQAEVDGNLYISDVTFTKEEITRPEGPSEEPEEPVVRLENEVLKVTEATAGDVYLFDGSANRRFSYVDASTLGFEGKYTGGAAKHDWFNNMGYRVATSITAEEVDALKEKGYVDVSLWFALGGAAHTGDQIVFVRDNGTDSKATVVQLGTRALGYDSFSATGLQTNKWYKLTISLDQFKSTLSNGYFNLVGSWDWAGGGAGRAFYVGDILFEKEAESNVTFPEIITMTEDTANQVWINGGSKFEYVDATTLGFAGEYTGTGAAKVHAAENVYYHFANPYTAEQLTEAKGAGYTKVAVWVAIDGGGFGDGAIWFRNNGPTLLQRSADQSGFGMWATNPAVGLQSKTWYKFTVTIDQYSECCVDNYVKLVYINQYASNFDRNFYVGNIYFE